MSPRATLPWSRPGRARVTSPVLYGSGPRAPQLRGERGMLAKREVSRPTRRRPRSGREWGRLTNHRIPQWQHRFQGSGSTNRRPALGTLRAHTRIQWLPCSGYEQLTVSHLGVRIEEVGTWAAVRGVIVHTGVAAGQPVITVFATQGVVVRSGSAVEDASEALASETWRGTSGTGDLGDGERCGASHAPLTARMSG